MVIDWTILANGDAVLTQEDPETGAISTETIAGYMWPLDDHPEAGCPAEATLRELPDPRVTDLDGDDLPW
jgi:hypothetical protein